ncbi:hypothetical protein DFP72DRAFT_854613 [Ephemerocybe angulata]|uniref:F-box domain-containing protein n=1 Tax=Ephemerocybe angulata TaxID=980116 RepID=A0A8H6LYA5_9AGAR|nr:hypothetical protein DFP72DRAFT_854613 [Tulosesus angulatus]
MHAPLRHAAATFLPLGSSAHPSSKSIIPTIQQLDPNILTRIFKLTAAQSIIERGKLEGVCRWWRAVIVQEPGFWTTIGIQYDTMPTLDALVTSHIPIYLERARKEPLSLYPRAEVACCPRRGVKSEGECDRGLVTRHVQNDAEAGGESQYLYLLGLGVAQCGGNYRDEVL